jgi:hypothetical protein
MRWPKIEKKTFCQDDIKAAGNDYAIPYTMYTVILKAHSGQEIRRDVREYLLRPKDQKLVSTLHLTNPSDMRQFFVNFITSYSFSWSMDMIILASCFVLVWDGPALEREENEHLRDGLEIVNYIFASIFTIEFIITIATLGPDFFDSRWNVLDAVVMLCCWIGLLWSSGRVFSSFRVFRIVRLMIRSDRLKLAMRSIWYSLARVYEVLLFCMTLYMVFAIFSLQLYMGQFSSCTDLQVVNKTQCVDTFLHDGLLVERRWAASYHNFDDIFRSVLTVFMMSTCSSWSNVMRMGMAIQVARYPRIHIVYILSVWCTRAGACITWCMVFIMDNVWFVAM